MDLKIPLNAELVAAVSRLDHFGGQWSANHGVSAERLARLEEAARVQSTAASCRLGGLRVSDADVAGLLRGEALPLRDSAEILGYAAALTAAFPGSERLVGIEDLRSLHGLVLGNTGESGWRTQPLHREGFDREGKATGLVFPSLPPRLVEEKTEELLTWLELELRSGEQHAILVIGTFVLYFLAVSPFERGNGRVSRVLTSHLLRRAGYGFVPCASLEREVEELRERYQQTQYRAQTGLWTGEGDIEPWLGFFVEVLDRHRERVATKLVLEREVRDYPPLQRVILETVREHGDVDAGLLLRATGANRNTLKDNLRRLVVSGVLEKTGQRRGTRYRISSGAPARPSAEGGVES